MRTKRFPILIVVAATCLFSQASEKGPAPNLSSDEIAIYRAVLTQQSSIKKTSLNVARWTVPLDLASHSGGHLNDECLKGIQLQNLAELAHSSHQLTADVLPASGAQLVDPKRHRKIVGSNDPGKTMRQGKSADQAVADAFATALFSMSEIAFDKDHMHAVMVFSFWCGSLCGHGSTLVFQKVNGQWNALKLTCGGWIS
jgi:hypothetical protein